jgi:dipeptidyl aminopeptidase/acylaminoacyl peptidase
MRRLLSGITVLVLAPGLLAAQETRTIVPEDYYEVQRLSSPALSPDGRHLLYQVETVRQDTNDRINHIWWTDLATDRTRRLSTAGVNSTNPRWTPDGRRVYFNTSRGGESGLHFINFTEPGGEAYRIPGISGSPNFHPDGSWVLVTRQVRGEGEAPEPPGASNDDDGLDEAVRHLFEPAGYWPSGTPGLTGPSDRAARGQTEEERNLDVYVIAHTNYKRDGTLAYVGPGGGGGGFGGFGGQGQNSYTQFFRVPADGLAPGEEAEQITSDEVNKNFREFSRDGRWILYTASVPAAEPEEDDDEDTGVFRIPATGGDPELLYQTSYQVRNVSMSPDNGRLAYVTVEASQTDPFIRVADIADGSVREMAREDWVYSIGNVTWSVDGSHLLWTSAIGGQDQLVRVPAGGGPVERVTDGRHTFNGFDMNLEQGMIAYVKSTGERPWEAFVASIEGSGERQVTAVNEEWLEGVRLSRVEHFAFEGTPHNRDWLDELPRRGAPYMLENRAPDGERFEVDAWLVYPVDYVEGQRYPMVVSIHGGPHSRYAETWFPEFQMLAAEDMFVLYTNPRGSSGYGMEFQFSTLNAWGIDDTKDILDAVEIAVERGLADPDRLGITGGSYGGFMTSWITAHDQRWRAALTARGIVNWFSFYGVSDASGLVEREFGGMPWPYQSDEEGSYNLVMELSPIVWADQVETPTLIIHSINDYRTPLEGADQWYRALQKHDVPVRMVLFPDSSHGLSRTGEPWLLVRRLHEYVDWFGSWLVGTEAVTVDSAEDGSES